MTDTPTCHPVTVIGDQVAAGIAVNLPEADRITQDNIGSAALKTLIQSTSAYQDLVGTDPWIVIAIGTNDGTNTTYANVSDLRAWLNTISQTRHPGCNPYIIWVLPVNNCVATSIIKRVAGEYTDLVIDMPDFITSSSQTASRVPVYYPFPWSQVFNSPPTVWYYQTITQNQTTQQALTDDNVIPNISGYRWVVDALRTASSNWANRWPVGGCTTGGSGGGTGGGGTGGGGTGGGTGDTTAPPSPPCYI